jgi:hypothetical protein
MRTDAETIRAQGDGVAAEVCVFTNANVTVEALEARPRSPLPLPTSHDRVVSHEREGISKSTPRVSIMNPALTPKAIVAALDEHIIGQQDAKRAVAVALRNRWRASGCLAELRDEVTPKNILMIGPTGCGKTEISRRLAKLADAPFVKVEATKFTEVGYVGRDVEQIARDLVEEAIRLEKDRRREPVRCGDARRRWTGCSTRWSARRERGHARELPPAHRPKRR